MVLLNPLGLVVPDGKTLPCRYSASWTVSMYRRFGCRLVNEQTGGRYLPFMLAPLGRSVRKGTWHPHRHATTLLPGQLFSRTKNRIP